MIRYFAILAVMVMAAVGTAAAWQYGWNELKVELPFAVMAGKGHPLPPGTYTFDDIRMEGQDTPFLVIRDAAGTERATVEIRATRMEEPAGRSKVKLLQLDGKYYLDTIWIGGKNEGWQVILPKNIRSRASEGTRIDVDVEVVPAGMTG